jgi:chitin synthase
LHGAFGRAKTQANPDATRYSSYTELHFSSSTFSSADAAPGSAVVGARVLAWGLDKSRLTRLHQDERTFYIFYQLLSGATPALLDYLQLDDASDYALLASSSCYRLPGGPFSDDAMRALGFKERHSEGIWRLLSALLALGNIMFEEALSARHDSLWYRRGTSGLGGIFVDGQEEVRHLNPGMLDRAARLLGVGSEDLKEILMTRLGYVKKEVVSAYLDAKGAGRQRDRLVGGLYILLFAYIVETGNHKLKPEYASGDSNGPLSTQIVLLDLPGFTTRTSSNDRSTLLNAASGGNGFTEFMTNFQDELVHSYTLHHPFEESLPSAEFRSRDGLQARDSVGLPSVLLESRRVTGVLRGDPFTSTPSLVGKDGRTRATNFGVVHYAGTVTYGIGANVYEEEWVERDADNWDPGFLKVLRGGEGFIKRFVGFV